MAEDTDNQGTKETPADVPQEAEAVEAAVEPGEAEPLPEEVSAEPEAAAENPAEEPVPDVPVAATEEPPPTEAEVAEAPAEEAAPEPAAAEKKKRKRLPRAQRRQRTKPTRERPAVRKPIARQPKPESEHGRRQERRGVVVSNAMDKTIVVKVDTIKAHPRYKKVVRRSVKFHAHDPQNQANVGDIVRIVETRPLSKTKNWRLAEVVEAAR